MIELDYYVYDRNSDATIAMFGDSSADTSLRRPRRYTRNWT